MSKTRFRTYIDVEGNPRKISYVEKVDRIIPYRYNLDITASIKQVVYSPAECWRLEDGSLVQIPTEAWHFYGIDFQDHLL